MQPHVMIEVTAGTLQQMTTPQFEALRDNVLAEGHWEPQTEPVRVIGGTDYIGVQLETIYIGIEKDGYTHS